MSIILMKLSNWEKQYVSSIDSVDVAVNKFQKNVYENEHLDGIDMLRTDYDEYRDNMLTVSSNMRYNKALAVEFNLDYAKLTSQFENEYWNDDY